MKVIPYGRQSINQSDIDAVIKVLKTDWISQGPKIREFEEAVAKDCGSKYAVAVSSGTAALHLACVAAGLGKGYEAITTPISFLATSNAAVYTGARPVFADIEYETVNIDPKQVKKKLSRRTRAILPVHFAGLPADVAKLRKLAPKKKIRIIEDGCHAMGAVYKGYKVGSCAYSDMTAFSLHPVKHITGGEGGLITTNDRELYQQLITLRNHGVYRTQEMAKKHGKWFNEMRELGYNYRITDIQSALGRSQLKRLANFVAKRRKIAAAYSKAFKNLQEFIILPDSGDKNRKHSWHLYLLRIRKNASKWTRKSFFQMLSDAGVAPQVHYIPIYKQPYYQKYLNGNKVKCPNAEKYYEEVLSLPVFPDLQDSDLRKVIRLVQNAFLD